MSSWYKIVKIEDIPNMGSRLVKLDDLEIAIFKTKDDSIFAINNICPHKQGKLSEGLVHEHIVTCPLHNWEISLQSGETLGEDKSCTNIYNTLIKDDILYIEMEN